MAQNIHSGRKILALTLSLLLAGCASIPLLTMWRLHSMTGEDLANLNVNEVQAAVQMPTGFEPDISSFRLKLTLSKDHKTALERVFKLRKLGDGRLVLPGIPMPGPDKNLYLMALTPQSKQELEQLQPLLSNAKQNYDGFNFRINFKFLNIPSTAAGITLSMWIQLRADQGFFEILKNATLKIDHNK